MQDAITYPYAYVQQAGGLLPARTSHRGVERAAGVGPVARPPLLPENRGARPAHSRGAPPEHQGSACHQGGQRVKAERFAW